MPDRGRPGAENDICLAVLPGARIAVRGIIIPRLSIGLSI